MAQPARHLSNGDYGKTISGVSDLPLSEWKNHGDIITDSLWILGDRDKSGSHDGFYHGNFIPQIPNQLIRRYTRAGGVVLDPFLGSGTTMIEAKRLGRNCIGIEISPKVAKSAERLVSNQPAEKGDVFSHVIVGNSVSLDAYGDIACVLDGYHHGASVDLIIMHPPYHDIIQFTDNPDDLSNSKSVDDFVERFGDCVENFSKLLADGHYLAVIIGDKYADGEWIPLGSYLMHEVMKRPKETLLPRTSRFALKSVIVKNMVNNRAKRNAENLWRYRALVGGFYVFRHEYILLFQKKKVRR